MSTTAWEAISVIIVILGPVLASFFAATVMRQTGATKASGSRSECDHCGHQLDILDLIPILSFVWLRGKCRYCHKRIDPKMWLCETLGLVLYFCLAIGVSRFYVASASSIEVLIYILFGFALTTLLFYLAVYDIFTFSIPERFTQLTGAFVILANIVVVAIRLVDPTAFRSLALGRLDNLLLGVLFASLMWLLIVFTKQKGLGMGDVLIALILGLGLGWPGTVSAFYVTVISASVIGLGYVLYRHKFRKIIIPLVPFLTFGFVVAYVWGNMIFNLLFPLI